MRCRSLFDDFVISLGIWRFRPIASSTPIAFCKFAHKIIQNVSLQKKVFFWNQRTYSVKIKRNWVERTGGKLTLLQGRTHKSSRGKLAVWRNLHRSFLHQEISWAGYAVESYMNFCDQLFDCSLSSIIFTCSIWIFHWLSVEWICRRDNHIVRSLPRIF